MMTMQGLRTARREEILRLAKARGACDVRVFGSAVRDSRKPGLAPGKIMDEVVVKLAPVFE